MPSAHIAYDTRSGRIISVHYGPIDTAKVRERARHHAKIAEEHLALIAVSREAVEQGKRYKVDVGGGKLVETAPGENGVGFSLGMTGRLPSSGTRQAS